MDPAWVQIWIALGSTIVGSVVTGAIWYGAVKAWMARREEREQSMGVSLGRLQDQVTGHGGLLADHAVRLGVIENEVGLRGPPDFARR